MDIVMPENIFRHIVSTDIIDKLQPELEEKYYLDPETHRYKSKGRIELTETPWVHAKQDPSKDCKYYHFIFGKLGFIPKRCLKCWKVVVRPRTIKELWLLYHVQLRMDRYSKCGIEERPYVRGLYGGYFYNNSYEEGRQCQIEVKQAIKGYIGYDLPVILKRYCTEFEVKLKDSMKYQRPSYADEQEAWMYAKVENNEGKAFPQDQDIKLHTFNKWIQWAWKFDMSDDVFEFGKPEDFYTTPRTY